MLCRRTPTPDAEAGACQLHQQREGKAHALDGATVGELNYIKVTTATRCAIDSDVRPGAASSLCGEPRFKTFSCSYPGTDGLSMTEKLWMQILDR